MRTLLASAERPVAPVLVVLTGPQVGQRILLESKATIGRDPEADLMLVGDGVEWHHATVLPRGGEWVLVDVSGERLTALNGMPVLEAALHPDDQISIGRTVLRFELQDPVEQAFHEAIEERLSKDDLTGLLSRRAFDLKLSSAVVAAERHGRTLGLLVVDIDGVKVVNDRLGHLVGARVITAVGRAIGALVSDDGCACRLGGDEFGVLLPGVGLNAAERMGVRLRDAVRGLSIPEDGEELRVTISVGVAGFPEHGAEPLELLRRADEAMYAVKGRGGDAVGRFEPP